MICDWCESEISDEMIIEINGIEYSLCEECSERHLYNETEEKYFDLD